MSAAVRVLTEQIATVAPIDGVSMGDLDDKATWRVDFAADASETERRAAQQVIDAFNVVAVQRIDGVRAEAERRMVALLGARDSRHKDILISNALREAVKLTRKEAGVGLTTDERARADELEAIDAALDAIRAASNALEAMDRIPADYADKKYWPAQA